MYQTTGTSAPMHQPVASQWEADCLRWVGEILTGDFAHWCPEWDQLPVDETQWEFACCTCSFGSEQELADKAKAAVRRKMKLPPVKPPCPRCTHVPNYTGPHKNCILR